MRYKVFALVSHIFALAACTQDAEDMVANGSALAQLRSQVDGRSQCATLISGSWPIDLSGDLLDTNSVDALVAAGLFVRQRSPTGVAPHDTRLVPTPVGQRAMHLVKGLNMPMLCFGRMKVTAVSAITSDDGDSGGVSYRYRLVDLPAWTKRSDIKAVFPFIQAMSRQELRSPLRASLKKGQLILSDPPEEARPVGFEMVMFDTCSLPPDDRGLRCRY